MSEFMNTVAATYFASDYAGVTHSGIALVAADTGRVFLTKRAEDETDAPEVAETWEFPGGGLKEDESPWNGAVREFIEEVGVALPDDVTVVNGWRSDNGVYQGFVVSTSAEFDTDGWTPTTEVADVGWFDRAAFDQMVEVGALRPEMKEFDWNLISGVSGNEEIDMSLQMPEVEPDLTDFDLATGPIPVHGVLAPEGVESGDRRAFAKGSMTTRPLRIPFSWQKSAIQQHDGSVQIGSVDRLMRKDGLIHWEGQLMNTPEADEYAGLLAFMGRSGVSVDGDQGSVDEVKSRATDSLWFDHVRSAGLTGVSIPAFHEAYAALGPHPDMPPADDETALTASGLVSGDVVGARGPGWVTNPSDTRRIHDYWMPGHPGGDKIAWGTPGDFARAKALIGAKIAEHSPSKVRFLNQIIAQWHHDALGYWPATHAKMVREGKASGGTMTFKNYTTAQRKAMAKKGQALPDGSYPIADCADLSNAIQSIGRASDPMKAKAHIRKRKKALGCPDVDLPWSVIPSSFSIEPIPDDLRGEAYCLFKGCGKPGEYEVDTDNPHFYGIYCATHAPEYEGKSLFDDYTDAIADAPSIETGDTGWEAVLVSSVHGNRMLPPKSYFDYQPGSGALVIEEPDEAGIRHTYGYAGEWGVCHIGFDGRCVEVPDDGDESFSSFHLGRTKTGDGYINTGVITYKVDHRGSRQILSETAEQQHFDNIAHAWAAVRLGVDDRGIWFSGVVLPTVPEDDIVLIEAAGQVSGEWKRGSLRALQAVNTPGFAIEREEATYDDEGNLDLLVASAFAGPCEATPAQRMEALRRADAETRFESMKKEWS